MYVISDRWAAIAWICANQLHKHNMNEMQRLKLIQEEYEARKKTQGTNNQYVQAKRNESGEIDHFHSKTDKTPKVRAEIAKEHGINEGIVKTAVEVGQCLAWLRRKKFVNCSPNLFTTRRFER